MAVFALASIVTIAAAIVYTTVAPDRAAAHLDNWKRWLAGHARTIGIILLTVIGIAMMLKAV